jgi:hypothetical protein
MSKWFFELFEQKAANTLKLMFMDTQRLISESENEIAKWEALIKNEKEFLSKVVAKNQALAIERAKLARKEADERLKEIAAATNLATKYKR